MLYDGNTHNCWTLPKNVGLDLAITSSYIPCFENANWGFTLHWIFGCLDVLNFLWIIIIIILGNTTSKPPESNEAQWEKTQQEFHPLISGFEPMTFMVWNRGHISEIRCFNFQPLKHLLVPKKNGLRLPTLNQEKRNLEKFQNKPYTYMELVLGPYFGVLSMYF